MAKRIAGARRRLARWAPALLLLGTLTLVDQVYAGGAPDDVADTHARLQRIYRQLGIRRESPKPPEPRGCQCKRSGRRAQPKIDLSPPPALPPVLGYVLIGLVLAAMVVPLVLALRGSYAAPRNKRSDAGEEEEPAPDGGLGAPWQVTLEECRRLVAAGRVAEALAALHRLTLLDLERAGLLALDATTTNWEYVRRLAFRSPQRRLLTDVTIAAERAVLGGHVHEAEDYRRLERELIEQMEGGG